MTDQRNSEHENQPISGQRLASVCPETRFFQRFLGILVVRPLEESWRLPTIIL